MLAVFRDAPGEVRSGRPDEVKSRRSRLRILIRAPMEKPESRRSSAPGLLARPEPKIVLAESQWLKP